MKRETLFDAITNVKDEYVEEMETRPLKLKKKIAGRKKVGIAIAAAAAAVLLAAGISAVPRLAPNFGSSAGGAGHEEGSVFLSYAGPVFPLSLKKENTGLTVRRALTYDFSPWNRSSTDLMVTDEYILTNPTTEDKTVTLRYPFAGTFRDLKLITPALYADGKGLDAVLTAGPYSGSFISEEGSGKADETLNFNMPDSWEVYRYLFEEAGYQEKSYETVDSLNEIPVIVYQVENVSLSGEKTSDGTSLALNYSIDYDTVSVLSYGFNGSRYDRESGFGQRSFFIPETEDAGDQENRYLIVIGGDIRDVKVQGYQDGGCEEGEELDGITCTLTRYESSLGEMVSKAAEEYSERYLGNRDWINDETKELYVREIYRLAAEYGPNGENPMRRYEGGMLDQLIGDVESLSRVFYLESTVTVRAGESVTVSAEMIRQGSYDFYCAHTENQGIYGYDMTTQIGSSLNFLSLEAKVINTEQIEMVRNNYGFSLEKGITEVSVTEPEPHYYMEVKRKN